MVRVNGVVRCLGMDRLHGLVFMWEFTVIVLLHYSGVGRCFGYKVAPRTFFLWFKIVHVRNDFVRLCSKIMGGGGSPSSPPPPSPPPSYTTESACRRRTLLQKLIIIIEELIVQRTSAHHSGRIVVTVVQLFSIEVIQWACHPARN